AAPRLPRRTAVSRRAPADGAAPGPYPPAGARPAGRAAERPGRVLTAGRGARRPLRDRRACGRPPGLSERGPPRRPTAPAVPPTGLCGPPPRGTGPDRSAAAAPKACSAAARPLDAEDSQAFGDADEFDVDAPRREPVLAGQLPAVHLCGLAAARVPVRAVGPVAQGLGDAVGGVVVGERRAVRLPGAEPVEGQVQHGLPHLLAQAPAAGLGGEPGERLDRAE